MCCHGTCLAPVDRLVAGFFDEYFYDNGDEVSIAATQAVAYDFRFRFPHNSNIRGAEGHVI